VNRVPSAASNVSAARIKPNCAAPNASPTSIPSPSAIRRANFIASGRWAEASRFRASIEPASAAADSSASSSWVVGLGQLAW
jgi:hypothetical protein